MKKIMLVAVACFGLLSAFADDPTPTFNYTSAGVKTVEVDGNGSTLTNVLVNIEPNRAIVPWKVEVLDATAVSNSETTEFVPTNYVAKMTSTVTNLITDTRSEIVTNTIYEVGTTNVKEVVVITNTVPYVKSVSHTATVTNTLNSIAGLDLTKWTVITTNGYNKTVTSGSSAKTNGTLTLTDSNGSSWSALTFTNGECANTSVFDPDEIAYNGSLKVTTTGADKVKFRIQYLKLDK